MAPTPLDPFTCLIQRVVSHVSLGLTKSSETVYSEHVVLCGQVTEMHYGRIRGKLEPPAQIPAEITVTFTDQQEADPTITELDGPYIGEICYFDDPPPNYLTIRMQLPKAMCPKITNLGCSTVQCHATPKILKFRTQAQKASHTIGYFREVTFQIEIHTKK
jgi:hypothetical protein